MIEAYASHVIVKTDAIYENYVKFKGLNGREIYIDHRFDPQRHARIYAEVVSVPRYIQPILFMQEHAGVPPYHGHSNYSYKMLDSIEPEVQVGDKVYMHFNAMISNLMIKKSHLVREDGVHPNKTWYFKVRYDNLIAVVRNGVTIPVGSFVLCDPDWESWDEISRPTPVTLNGKPVLNKDGTKMMKPKEQWLVTKVAPGYQFLKAFVRVLGTPLRGDKCEIAVGQKIWYRRNADWMVKIEGKDYFAIRQRHIIGREEEVVVN